MQRHALEAIGGFPVHHILLTHHHEDHSGNAAAFQKQTGATVRGHARTAAKLQKGFRILPYQYLVWGRTTPVIMKPLTAPIESDLHVLTPVATPGHSKDHLVFLEKNYGWLFSGDLYIGERIKFFRSDEDIDAQIHSLQQVMQLDFDTLFCAHNPCLQNGKQHLSRKLDFLVTLKQKVMALHQKGNSTREIVRRLDPGTDRRVKWVTMGNASFANMVRSALKSVQ
jgi:glyoxylase-like metal-dependent hydrolase (beta-lactamase superfamily II)